MTDLVLKGGRVLDPASGRDEIADIAFGEGKVTEVGRDLRGADTIDARGLLVVPGLIDLHTHVYWGGISLGVDAAEVARRSGTTTFVDGNTRATESLQTPRWRCGRGSDAFDVREVDHAATDFPEFNFIAEHVGLPRL